MKTAHPSKNTSPFESFKLILLSIMRNSADSVSISDEWQPVGACGSKLIEMLKEVCLQISSSGVLSEMKFCTFQGPYVYELFSIMIHSGSAIGGHYYAYIK